MVNEVRLRGQAVYECELCGFGYRDLETAERCEDYCYVHATSSPRITRNAIRKPSVEVNPIVA
jgi:hypothetical protein